MDPSLLYADSSFVGIRVSEKRELRIVLYFVSSISAGEGFRQPTHGGARVAVGIGNHRGAIHDSNIRRICGQRSSDLCIRVCQSAAFRKTLSHTSANDSV